MEEPEFRKAVAAIVERRERTAMLLETPDAMPTIFAHVAEGGSLTDLCETWQVRYSDIIKWIRMDKDRAKQYAEALTARSEWVRESVLTILRKLSLRGDIRTILEKDGTLKPPSEWPDDVAAAVTSLEIDEITEYDKESGQHVVIGQSKKIKMVDKVATIKLLGQTLAMFTERHEVEHKLTFEQLVGKAHKRDATVIEAKRLG